MSIPNSLARKLGIVGKGRPRPQRGTMNRLEAKYAEYLRICELTGVIAKALPFESIKLRLADNTTLTVDFPVMLADGTLEMRDVKGFKKKANGEPGYWIEDDANVKLKVAAEIFPFVFKVTFQDKAGVWHEEEI